MAGKAQTYCPRLWDEFYIEQNGNVFACCHQGPGILGNLYEDSLREISEGDRLREFRRQSLQGNLPCYERCTLLTDRTPPSPGITESFPYEGYRRLKILFSEFCNISCIMCWQDHSDRSVLPADLLKRQVELSPFDSIEIQGGEPLVIREARRFFEIAAVAGKKISFLTNGLSISDEWAEKIARHSRHVHFSLNAATKETHEQVNRGSSWEKVWRNIDRVKAWRTTLNSPLVVLGHFTIVRENVAEVPMFVRRFGDAFDELSFFYDPCIPKHLDSTPDLREHLARQLQEVPGRLSAVGNFGLARLADLGLLPARSMERSD